MAVAQSESQIPPADIFMSDYEGRFTLIDEWKYGIEDDGETLEEWTKLARLSVLDSRSQEYPPTNP